MHFYEIEIFYDLLLFNYGPNIWTTLISTLGFMELFVFASGAGVGQTDR